jgi:translation initiation factor 6 (eIF-6)
MNAPTLGVYMNATDRPAGIGRYLCLIHTGNYVGDVVGCIAVGQARGILVNPKTKTMERAVLGSIGALQRIRDYLSDGKMHQLTIAPVGGARGTA